MSVTLQLPENIEQYLAQEWHDMPRRILDAVAVRAYRDGILSRGMVSELLGLNFWETEAFLKGQGAFLDFDDESFEEDLRSSRLAEM